MDWEVFSRGVLACVGSGVVLADVDGTILLGNPALERLFGYETGELTGKSIKVLMPPYEAQHHGAYMRRYLEIRQSDFVGQASREIVAQRKDGTLFPLNITVHPVQMAGATLFVAALDESDEKIRGGVSTMDIAKRLIYYGYHPPTVYFPLVVHGAIMIEPTETETIDTLDRFIDVMKAIAEEVKTDPQLLKEAPTKTKIRRVDETRAAREPILRWK